MPELVSVEKIWGQAPHNAFTDLIRFRERWWCVFREAEGHDMPGGTVRVLISETGAVWESAATVEEGGIDLRDPKLSVTPDGRLMLVMGGCIYDDDGEYLIRAPRVSFSEDGLVWSAPRRVLSEDHWLWRVTWHDGRAYSLSKLGEGDEPRRGFLYSSTDGIEWDWIAEFRLDGVSETTLRFLPDGEMVALVRPGYIGTSSPPYREWSFCETADRIGGPNFIRLPDDSLWGSGRLFTADGPRTVLARMTTSSYEPVLTLPSGGDTSYAGMVWHDDLLWMSYYSSHEDGTNVYLAKVGL
ncbi:MAG: exo-alpha-sialidase [Chloroflexota bacterium]|nr:exo-alpha-sialidase [Chloroflexota bacterium]